MQELNIGRAEERLKSVVKAINAASGDIILFVDELHTIVGAGKTDGSLDAGNMLKPSLARGELHCIGATTYDEYKKYIEKDVALARRFQQVPILEPNEEETITMLRGLSARYELHHGVEITHAALVEATRLAKRYISGRYSPDREIDLIDEAASRVRMERNSKPEDLDRVERRHPLKIEQEAVREEDDVVKRKIKRG